MREQGTGRRRQLPDCKDVWDVADDLSSGTCDLALPSGRDEPEELRPLLPLSAH